MNNTNIQKLKKDVEEVKLMTPEEAEKIVKITGEFVNDFEVYVGACCNVHPLLIILLKNCESFNDWKNKVKQIKNRMRSENMKHLTGKVLVDCEGGLVLK